MRGKKSLPLVLIGKRTSVSGHSQNQSLPVIMKPVIVFRHTWWWHHSVTWELGKWLMSDPWMEISKGYIATSWKGKAEDEFLQTDQGCEENPLGWNSGIAESSQKTSEEEFPDSSWITSTFYCVWSVGFSSFLELWERGSTIILFVFKWLKCSSITSHFALLDTIVTCLKLCSISMPDLYWVTQELFLLDTIDNDLGKVFQEEASFIEKFNLINIFAEWLTKCQLSQVLYICYLI